MAQSFRVQCPTNTVTHPNPVNNNSEPTYVGPTYTGANGYGTTPAHVNGAIKCQQISGGDGYATMGDGTQTYLFSFGPLSGLDRKSTRLNSSHSQISYAVFCLKKKRLGQSS